MTQNQDNAGDLCGSVGFMIFFREEGFLMKSLLLSISMPVYSIDGPRTSFDPMGHRWKKLCNPATMLQERILIWQKVFV